jgi:hypothetical protein
MSLCRLINAVIGRFVYTQIVQVCILITPVEELWIFLLIYVLARFD